MAQVTDRTQAGPGDAAVDAAELAGLVLTAVAEHFTDVNPSVVLDAPSLLICVSTTAYELAGRSIGTDSAAMSRAAMDAVPEMPAGVTRGAAAVLMREAVEECGHEWTEADNGRVIPRIPGQRPAPEPKGPEQSAAPLCCGRPMRRDGQQFVCRKCGGWTDRGGDA